MKAIATLMLGSREAFVNYTMPLGLHHLIGGDHYAVMPENDDKRRLDWSATYYHRADDKGVGFDRTRNGSGAVDQYAKPNADRWNDPKTTPENLLLWFHHLPWDYRLNIGADALAGPRRALPQGRRAGRADGEGLGGAQGLGGRRTARGRGGQAADSRRSTLPRGATSAWPTSRSSRSCRRRRPPVRGPVPPTARLLAPTRTPSRRTRNWLEKARRGRIDVYFAGDSITRRWGATDYPDLLAHWTQQFFGWNAANFGWGGDTTQNILWRLHNGELDDVHPKVIVLLAGTNNVGSVTDRRRRRGQGGGHQPRHQGDPRRHAPQGAEGDDRPDSHLSPQRQHGGRCR